PSAPWSERPRQSRSIFLAPHGRVVFYQSLSKSSQVPRISRPRRRPRSSIRKWTVEDEKEDEDDWVAAPPRCAVSQSWTLPAVGKLRRVGPILRSAEHNSAIRQIENLYSYSLPTPTR